MRLRTRPAPAVLAALALAAPVALVPMTANADEPAAATTAAATDQADLRADVDRDGTVDLVGRSDERKEQRWKRQRGAVVLPNLDDDQDRCAPSVHLCNDASDDVVNGAADADDLARLRTVPVPGAPAGSSATVTSSREGVRLFVRRGSSWVHLDGRTGLTTAEVRNGAEIGAEATDVIRDAAVWDGSAKITLTLDQDGAVTRDRVRVRVAPLLTHHPLQQAEQIVVTNSSGGAQGRFVSDLREDVADAGIEAPLLTLPQGDIWTQDFFEPAYVSMTGPDGEPHSIRIMIRSHQNRSAGAQVFSVLRGPGIGAIEMTSSGGWETLNSFGNLETIPPYATDDASYPAGRIIMGRRGETGTAPSQDIRTMLSSQGFQEPLLLDTSWLYVGHVDEFVQFLPDPDAERGWTIGIADPMAGLDLLRELQADGHGAKRMFSLPGGPPITINAALGGALVADNEMAAELVAANLEVLLDETGVRRDEVVHVPALYARNPQGLFARLGAGGDRATGPTPIVPDFAAGLPDEAWQTGAEIPGAVNGVILSRETYLSPQQWGPEIDGVDVFGAAVEDAYGQVGMSVTFLDDWYSHHVGMGEVHCGTNTFRDTTWEWSPKRAS